MCHGAQGGTRTHTTRGHQFLRLTWLPITPLEHMVLEVGLEPTRPISANGFLELNVSAALALTTGYPASPLRLPIPPFEHILKVGYVEERRQTIM